MEKTAEKTVFISMSTVVSNRKLYENCAESLRGMDYQVIVSMGNTVDGFRDLPANIKKQANTMRQNDP